jgi:hypothetical protein
MKNHLKNKIKCQWCGEEGAERRRQRTAYVNDERNFAILCDECQEESHEYWSDMWNEYYRQVI